MRLIDHSVGDFDLIRDRFRWSIPEQLNIAQQVCDRHQANGDRIALFYENEAGKTASYSFAQIKRLSCQFANALKEHGVEQGDRVAILLSQRVETLIGVQGRIELGT